MRGGRGGKRTQTGEPTHALFEGASEEGGGGGAAAAAEGRAVQGPEAAAHPRPPPRTWGSEPVPSTSTEGQETNRSQQSL